MKMERNPKVIEKWRATARKVTYYFLKDLENAEKLEKLCAVIRATIPTEFARVMP